MPGRSGIVIPALAVLAIIGFDGCGIVRSLSGTEVDAEQFALARQAKTMQIRLKESVALAERLQQSNPLLDGDISVQISEEFLNNLADWYRGRTGWIDASTRYTVDSIHIGLFHGSAIATVVMHASRPAWRVHIALGMDCLVHFAKTETDIEMKLEPFGISPIVESAGFLVGSSEMIENALKLQLGRISEDFPPLKIPLDFGQSFPMDNQLIAVRNSINLDVTVPRKVIEYGLRIDEVIILREGVFIVLSQHSVRVR